MTVTILTPPCERCEAEGVTPPRPVRDPDGRPVERVLCAAHCLLAETFGRRA